MESERLIIALAGGEARGSRLGSLEPGISAHGRIAELDGTRLRKYRSGSLKWGQAAGFDRRGFHRGTHGRNACIDYDKLAVGGRRVPTVPTVSGAGIAGKLAHARPAYDGMYEAWFSIDRGGALNRLRRAAIVAFFVHLLAGASMALVLRRGLETNPEFQDRLSFLVNHRMLWDFGWLTWTAAALAILYFYIAFAAAHQPADRSNIRLHFAVMLTVAAIGPDLASQAIEIGVLPGIAYRVLNSNTGLELFLALHRVAVVMSGYIANGLYSMTAVILAWSTRQGYPSWVWIAGVAVGIFGFMLSAAALIDSATGMFLTNVLLVPAILLWLAGVAITSDLTT